MESALPVSQILFLEVWVELLQLFFFPPGLCRINDNAFSLTIFKKCYGYILAMFISSPWHFTETTQSS